MASLRILSKPLNGKVIAQPSKSMAHRAIICASLAKGKSKIDNVVLSDDIKATLEAMSSLGTDIELYDSAAFPGRKSIIIKSQGKITLKNNSIDCRESGSTARFIMPITRVVSEPVTITGRGRLVERPFDIYKNLFNKKGVAYSDIKGKMPIKLSGKLQPGEYTLPGDVSSQFVSGLLFALPLLNEPSKINITGKFESLPYIQMTLQVLNQFGINIEFDGNYKNFKIPPNQQYKPVLDYIVEGDWSQAAFFCVMGAIAEHITIQGLNVNSLQGDKVILNILEAMGAKAVLNKNGISFSKSDLSGISIDVSQCPDLVPAIATAACKAKGTTSIINGARLRIKESDRLLTTCRELSSLGASITELEDGLSIKGLSTLTGGKASGSGDHRIVMALAAASTICTEAVDIEGYEAVSKSYPGFWDDFITLGGEVLYL